MKRLIITLAVIASSCSTPTVPSPSKNAITHVVPLLVTDSLDFGSIPIGTSSDLNIHFKDTGSDSVDVIAQSLSDSSFSFPNFNSTLFEILPSAEVSVPIRFQPKDYASHNGFDTVRSHSQAWIVSLKGAGRTFSSMFDLPPKEITISLGGLIGKDEYASSPHDFSFEFDANKLQQWRDTLVFANSSYSDDNYTNDDQSTDISFHLDTTMHTIDWLKATYTHDVAHTIAPHWSTHNSESLNVQNIPLSREGTAWVGNVTAASLPLVVDTATYEVSSWPNNSNGTPASLQSIVGYEKGASLYITIQ